jgi:hypothetical protein
MQTPAILTGNYTRPDDSETFEYEVVLDVEGDRLHWQARIATIGVVRGRQAGYVANVDGMDDAEVELAVREAVESCIRERNGVQ